MNQPNIIILILDTVRARNLSFHGYPQNTTPHITAFAEQNHVFTRAFTTSTWTIPTHRSMLSGLYLSQHGIDSLNPELQYNEHLVPLPDAVRNAGYHTTGFSQNLLFSPYFHFDSFDEFHTTETLSGQAPAETFVPKKMKKRSASEMIRRYWRKTTSLKPFLDSMDHWIRSRSADQPFFLVANVTQVHAPWAPAPDILLSRLGLDLPRLMNKEYSAPLPFVFNSLKKQVTPKHREIWQRMYDAALQHTDRVLGRFMRSIQNWPGWEDTVFILTSDHGEVLGDHDDIVGHTLTLSDHVLHIPMVVKHPDYKSASRVNSVVQLLDLYPSIVGWSGAKGIPAPQLERPSLDSALADPESYGGVGFAEEDYTGEYDVIAGLRKVNNNLPAHHYPHKQTAIRTAHHKLVQFDDRPECFYVFRLDPEEQDGRRADLSPESQQKIKEMRSALTSWQAGLEVFPPKKMRPAKGLVDDRLRDLGYLP